MAILKKRPRKRWWWAYELAGLACTVALAWLLWPATLGGSTSLILVSGPSMEPTFQTGDLVVLRRGEPAIGDVVTFDPSQDGQRLSRVIHRVVGGDPSGWVTQGDNNEHPDQWRPTNDQLVGVEVLRIPFLGRVFPVFIHPLFIAVVLGAAVAVALWPRRDPQPAADPAPGAEPGGAAGRPPPPVVPPSTSLSTPTRAPAPAHDALS